MKTALFLGAGASVFAGMPTTKELVNGVLQRVYRHETWESPAAKSLATNIVNAHADKDVEVLYQTIRTMITAEKQHKETMEYRKKSDGGGTWKREIRTHAPHRPGSETTKDETADIDETIRTLESLEVAIRNTLLTSLTVQPDNVDSVVSLYDELFRHVPRRIVTTNYDNILEVYCEQKKLNLANGFKKSHLGDRRTWDGAWTGGETALFMTKLHGSITWQKDDGDTILEIGKPGMRDTDRDVMIAPTLGEKDYGDDIFRKLSSQFKGILDDTEMLIVVGFSFRDPEINQVLQKRLKRTDDNPHPMGLLCVDPKPDGLKEVVGDHVRPYGIGVENYGLYNYSSDEMPCVYAYRYKFDFGAASTMKSILEAISELCGGMPNTYFAQW